MDLRQQASISGIVDEDRDGGDDGVIGSGLGFSGGSSWWRCEGRNKILFFRASLPSFGHCRLFSICCRFRKMGFFSFVWDLYIGSGCTIFGLMQFGL